MEKETTIDLAKFEEAQKTINSIQNQFCEMVLDEIEKNPVVACESPLINQSAYSVERYPSFITVANTTVRLLFSVCPVKDEPDLSSDFLWLNLILSCSSFEISNRFIEPRKNQTVTLHFTNTGEDMLLQYKASEET